MRAATAYFIGAGSIVAAIAVGLGGGIVAGNIMHPIAPKQGPDTVSWRNALNRQPSQPRRTHHWSASNILPAHKPSAR